MLTPRGISVAVAGVAMWLAARFLGSPGLEIVAIGLALLPFIAGAVSCAGATSPSPVARHLSEARVPPGTRVTVRLDVSNPAPSTTSFLLLEDRLPPALGRPARLVVTGVGGRGTQRVSYSIVPQARGPLRDRAADGRSDRRVRALAAPRRSWRAREELLVTPEIEDLRAPSDAASGEQRRQRALAPTAAQRRGVLHDAWLPGGRRPAPDPLAVGRPHRRAHDPPGRGVAARERADVPRQPRSAARARRAAPAFERAVSCAASVGALFARNGFGLQLGADETPIHAVSEEALPRLAVGPRARSGPDHRAGAHARCGSPAAATRRSCSSARPWRPRSCRSSSAPAPPSGRGSRSWCTRWTRPARPPTDAPSSNRERPRPT